MNAIIVRDEKFLALPSRDANVFDVPIAEELENALKENLNVCVGMAANMIGKRVKIMAVALNPQVLILINPKIIASSSEYETEEACLSLRGVRKTKRYKYITVEYFDKKFGKHIERFEGLTAQIIQHEYDHFSGKLI